MAAGIALVEVAIGKTQTGNRTAKAAVINFFTRKQGVNGEPARCAHMDWLSTLIVPAGSVANRVSPWPLLMVPTIEPSEKMRPIPVVPSKQV
jgi:hypothetical protein